VREPSTLKGRRFGNVIIAGLAAPPPYAEIAQRVGRAPFPYRVLRGARLRQLLADSSPFSAADAEESPEQPAKAPGLISRIKRDENNVATIPLTRGMTRPNPRSATLPVV
jgi:hypothetical protein